MIRKQQPINIVQRPIKKSPAVAVKKGCGCNKGK